MKVKYNKEKLLEQNRQFTKDDFVFFRNPTRSKNLDKGCLSSWFKSDFIINGQRYWCAEQYILAKKATLCLDYSSYVKIIAEKSPTRLKQLGRNIKNFDSAIWREKVQEIVYDANYAKFTQNQTLRNYLYTIEGKIIALTNPYDQLLGIGMSQKDNDCTNPALWKGENLLGFVLTEIRDIIVNSTPDIFAPEVEICECIDEETGESYIYERQIVNDNYLESAQNLWEKALKEEENLKIINRAKGNRRINKKLYKFIVEQLSEYSGYDVIFRALDGEKTKEQKLEWVFSNLPEELPEFSISIEGEINEKDEIEWSSSFGDDIYHCTLVDYDSYSKVLNASIVGIIRGDCLNGHNSHIHFKPDVLQKQLTKRLKKFLAEHTHVCPSFKYPMGEENLVDVLNTKNVEVLNQDHKSIAHFEIEKTETENGRRWRAMYGIDYETYYSDYYKSYSSALENGAIEFITALNVRDENDNPYYYLAYGE